MRGMRKERWCLAVSLGRKPSPGGEMKVWRMLERGMAGPLLGGWRIRPTPSLLAEPSRPRDIIFCGGGGGLVGRRRCLRVGGGVVRRRRRPGGGVFRDPWNLLTCLF